MIDLPRANFSSLHRQDLSENCFYDRAATYALDQATIESDRQPARQLMFKAGLALWRAISERWPELEHVLIVAGNGNNGGDGYAVAVLLQQAGYSVEILHVGALEKQSAESKFYRQQCEHLGIPINCINPEKQTLENLPESDLILDALFGIGLKSQLGDFWQGLIGKMNEAKAIRVSADLPSGLDAECGMALPVAVKADLSVSFVARKAGSLLADGPDHCGELLFDSLGISSRVQSGVTPRLLKLTTNNVILPRQRLRNTHKFQFGHVLVIGGDRGYCGAVRLAARAALKTGAGLVSVAVHPENREAMVSSQVEVMVHDWNSLESLIESVSCVLIGPGLSTGEDSLSLLETLKIREIPFVVDAGALTAAFVRRLANVPVLMTPHPGEAARLLNCSSKDIQSDRLAAATQLSNDYRSSCILKGSGSLVSAEQQISRVCTHGHPGMATAGMGDVLAGICIGLIAQGMQSFESACTATLLHAISAELSIKDTFGMSLVAGDVIDSIPYALSVFNASGIQ